MRCVVLDLFITFAVIFCYSVAHQLKEHVILDYGTALMGHHSLWQVGVSYLDHCGEQGLARLEVLLCAIPLSSEMKALKIIDIAKKRKLHSVGKFIYPPYKLLFVIRTKFFVSVNIK